MGPPVIMQTTGERNSYRRVSKKTDHESDQCVSNRVAHQIAARQKGPQFIRARTEVNLNGGGYISTRIASPIKWHHKSHEPATYAGVRGKNHNSNRRMANWIAEQSDTYRRRQQPIRMRVDDDRNSDGHISKWTATHSDAYKRGRQLKHP